MNETGSEMNEIVEGFIFSSKFDEVLLVTSGSYWSPFFETVKKNKSAADTLCRTISNITNQNIKLECMRQVCDIINLEKTRIITVFMTVTVELEKFCNQKDKWKTRIFRIGSLNLQEHESSLIWKVHLCLDQNVQGMLSRIVYYS